METLTKQQKYTMNIKDIAKIVRQELKKEFPACEFSVTIERYSMGQSMTVALMKTPFEVFDKSYLQDRNGNVYTPRDYEYQQLNHFTAIQPYETWSGYNNGSYITREAYQVLKRAVELTERFNYDDSDMQTDYFDVNFYLHLEIGKWNKPYQKI